MQRRSGILVLSLFLLGGLVQPAFADDAIGLESWQERADEGNFAQEIAGVYLIRHHTDEGTPGSSRLISLTAGGNWGSTYSTQDALFNLPGVPLPPEDVVYGNDLPGGDVFAPATLFNPARFSDQHGVWARSGWRELTAEVMNFNLAALTGVQTGQGTGTLCGALQQGLAVHQRDAAGVGLCAGPRPAGPGGGAGPGVRLAFQRSARDG